MICPACGDDKGDAFPSREGKTEKWWCVECKRRYHRQHAAKRRADGKIRNQSKHYRDRTVKSGGLRPDEYDDLMAWQESKCAICSKVKDDEPLAIDHNHFTGRIRGLLCGNCNRGLGLFKDDVVALKKAIDYLQRYPPEEDPVINHAEISGRYIDGESEQQIAYALGTTRRFVHDTLIRLGVPRRETRMIDE